MRSGRKIDNMPQNSWERRDKKKRGAWYKRHLANNRKSLEIIIRAKQNREEKQTW